MIIHFFYNIQGIHTGKNEEIIYDDFGANL